jgi:hypothetical protein
LFNDLAATIDRHFRHAGLGFGSEGLGTIGLIEEAIEHGVFISRGY